MILLFYVTANIKTMLLEISEVLINAFVNNSVLHFNTRMKYRTPKMIRIVRFWCYRVTLATQVYTVLYETRSDTQVNTKRGGCSKVRGRPPRPMMNTATCPLSQTNT